jgi:hypothetical protein
MRSSRTFLALFAFVALAACGGGSGGALPTAATDPGLSDPSGSTVAFEDKTIWVAYPLSAHAFSTNASGTVSPRATLGPFQWTNPSTGSIPALVDIAIAPDGTKWVLENRDFALGGPGWRLNAVAPQDTTAENTDGDNSTSPFSVALGGDAVMVGYTSGSGTTIASYPYAQSNATPVRTWQSNSQIIGFSSGNDGHFYVARTGGFDVYDPTSTGCCPVRSITTATPITRLGVGSDHGFAVGPDNSIYVTNHPNGISGPTAYVDVYPPGSGTIARHIGPLPVHFDALQSLGPVITVDDKNRLYVATNGQIYRFGPNANGAATPERVFTDSAGGQQPVALAIGPKL